MAEEDIAVHQEADTEVIRLEEDMDHQGEAMGHQVVAAMVHQEEGMEDLEDLVDLAWRQWEWVPLCLEG